MSHYASPNFATRPPFLPLPEERHHGSRGLRELQFISQKGIVETSFSCRPRKRSMTRPEDPPNGVGVQPQSRRAPQRRSLRIGVAANRPASRDDPGMRRLSWAGPVCDPEVVTSRIHRFFGAQRGGKHRPIPPQRDRPFALSMVARAAYCAASSAAAVSSRFAASIAAAFFSTNSTR
jgi:hypothetical protein